MRYTVERANYRPEVETAPLGQVGRRVGATALGLALVVPAVLPDVDASACGFGSGGFGPGRGGGQQVAVVNPILDLGRNLRRQGDNTPVIRYRGKPTYLRLVGLDEFTGKQWQPSELEVSRDDDNVEDGMPPAARSRQHGAADPAAPTASRSIDLDQAVAAAALPVAPGRRSTGPGSTTRSTFNVFGENSLDPQICPTTVSAIDVTADRRGAAPRREGRLPDVRSAGTWSCRATSTSEVVRSQTQVTMGATPTDYDQALAHPGLAARPRPASPTPRRGRHGRRRQRLGRPSRAFLQTRQGYCVHFASTMAVMARHARHPGPGRRRLRRRAPPTGRATATWRACTTPTPGRSCTSRASAGCRSSRPPRPAPATRRPGPAAAAGADDARVGRAPAPTPAARRRRPARRASYATVTAATSPAATTPAPAAARAAAARRRCRSRAPSSIAPRRCCCCSRSPR